LGSYDLFSRNWCDPSVPGFLEARKVPNSRSDIGGCKAGPEELSRFPRSLPNVDLERETRMSPKERFLASVSHLEPDRIPLDVMHFQGEILKQLKNRFHVDTEEEVYLKIGIDFRKGDHWICLPPEYYSGPLPEVAFTAPNQNVSYWGTKEKVSSATLSHGIPFGDTIADRPLHKASSIKDVEEYPWPNADHFDYQAMTNECKEHQPLVVRVHAGAIFCRICRLAGMETTLENLLLRPRIIEAMTERITDFYYEAYKRFFSAGSQYVDIFSFWDDVATDRGLFFNLKLWRRFFKKPLAKMFSLAKDFNLKVQYHCCGAMNELIPDLVEIGMDILEPCQFHLPGMDPKTLKREFGQHLTFYGGINSQRTLPFGTPEEVRQEVKERIDLVGKGGGYILTGDHSIEPDVPIDNILAMYDEAKSYSEVQDGGGFGTS